MRGAVVGVAVLVAGVIPGARAADTEQGVDIELAYTCAVSSGQQPEGEPPTDGADPGGADPGKARKSADGPGSESDPSPGGDPSPGEGQDPGDGTDPGDEEFPVTVRITATLPTTATTGTSIEAAGVTTEITLPDVTRTPLPGLKAAEVTGATRLTVAVAQGEHTAEARWEGTAAQPLPVPTAGALRLTATGLVPTVTAGDSGDLTLRAGALALDLTPRTADGAPTEPPVTALNCTPDSGTDTLLATVGVDGGANPSPEPSTPAPGPDDGAAAPGRPGTGDLGISPVPRQGGAPAAAPPCVGDSANPFAMVAYVTGYSNVAKLNGASEIPVSCAQLVDVSKKIVPKPDGLHLIQHATGELDYRGKPVMPPATATFLTYGFMPTTARMELRQLDTMTIDSDLLLAKFTGTTLVRLPLSIRLYDVKVNGVPLDVGPNCRTAGSLYSADPDPANTRKHVVLKGELKGPGNGYQLVTGGILSTTVTIPPFTGCGVGEDLDPLFTSSVSGPGNYLKQVQAAPCASGVPVPDARYCTPELQPAKVPKPER